MKPPLPACAVALLLGAAPVGAQVDLAYGPEYEAQFRASCGESWSTPVCQCALERLQRAVGYVAFAEAVRNQGERLLATEEGAVGPASLAECLARADGPRRVPALVVPVADQAARQATELAAAQELCRAREAALAPQVRRLVDRPDPRGSAELRAVVGNIAGARERCAGGGDVGRALAVYDHVAAFLDADGFGDELTSP